ncbi:hypothetical protein A3J17_05205 [Candidatus Curtissbacteria bacterium RIFCSPLOWO2_02_FULL_40_11]|uniref:DNA-binding protein n=2 Tax=Candidatus Curtissiibacteriota TaxID=1752717 RepID=A0A1F5G8S8_9BACT|nr:MAG: hypothetical protein A3D04_00600 [Candidatus Curtissbacteria bacterium RIFCSPHIGHO2_02_FULL_40_16b]OGE00054.1 MAG: hypothetical protein A3J17_05205 [Candidatus Curtissbacteria bacterium RIFCSPLOWO2_02_FULL_40_11]OGE13338.1 MAG: hypothetical protein A3G14_02615 [Candidatus Curtissbacteria bacterium RIFCSPLOWO2_12_FULL_38_9]
MKNQSLKSSKFRIGKRTFFFDVNVASNDSKYLRVTESRFVEEGKDHIRNSVVLFPEDVQSFQENLKEMVGHLN